MGNGRRRRAYFPISISGSSATAAFRMWHWAGTGQFVLPGALRATVCTINLPNREDRSDGTWAYGERVTDSSNVRQNLLCHSRDWDTANYPADFFDSVLIDGGHQSDVVINDSRKSFQVYVAVD
jgi:hypothetical protein